MKLNLIVLAIIGMLNVYWLGLYCFNHDPTALVMATIYNAALLIGILHLDKKQR